MIHYEICSNLYICCKFNSAYQQRKPDFFLNIVKYIDLKELHVNWVALVIDFMSFVDAIVIAKL